MIELKESNTASHRKVLQKLYKTIKEIDSIALIIWYQSEEDKEEISKKNKVGVGIMAKDALLNYNEAIPNYL